MRTVLLTGRTGDIGSEIANIFTQHQLHVIGPTRTDMDLLNPQSIVNFIKQLNTPIDVFIHCAGFNQPKPIQNIERTDLEKTLQINAISFYDMVHCLVTEKKINANGHILAISSIYGSLARRGRFSYVASKHCLHGMIKTLALELAAENIKCNTLSPGFVDTKLTSRNNTPAMIEGFKSKIPLGRLATPEEIAKVAYFLCSQENSYINGQEIIVDGGYSIGGFEA